MTIRNQLFTLSIGNQLKKVFFFLNSVSIFLLIFFKKIFNDCNVFTPTKI